MARRVHTATDDSTGRVKTTRVVLLLVQISAALVVCGVFTLLRGSSSATITLPLPDVATAAAHEAHERPPAPAADYSSNRRVTSKDRLAGNTVDPKFRTAPGEEAGIEQGRGDAAGAGAPADNASAAREQETVQKEAVGREASKSAAAERAAAAGGTKERVPADVAQDVASAARITSERAGTAGGSAPLDEKATENLERGAAAPSLGRAAAFEPTESEAAAAPTNRQLLPAGRRASKPFLRRRAEAPPTERPAAGLDRAIHAVTTEVTHLSPLATAAVERAAGADGLRVTTSAVLGDRSAMRGLRSRLASLKRGIAAALERTVISSPTRARIERNQAMSTEAFSEDEKSRTVSTDAPAVTQPAEGGSSDSSGSAAAGDVVDAASSTPAKADSTPPSSNTPRRAPIPIDPLPPPEISPSFAAALLSGTVRRLAFERCDRYTQKVVITASPGDTIMAECQGAARTVPTNIEFFCCRGSCGRCAMSSAVRYHTLYQMGSIPHFRYAAGDGIRSAWKVKIPESLRPPYPTFSVTWLGPAVLDIPTEATAGATGVPTTTLAIRVLAPRQLEDRIALLRAPGPDGECSVEERLPRREVEDDDIFLDEEVREEYARFYERTPFGLRRVSGAPAVAAPCCALRLPIRGGGGSMRELLPVLELLRCLPWSVVLSVAVTGGIIFWT